MMCSFQVVLNIRMAGLEMKLTLLAPRLCICVTPGDELVTPLLIHTNYLRVSL